MKDILREIPQISAFIERFKDRFSPIYITRVAREITSRYREEIKKGIRLTVEGIFEEVERELIRRKGTNLRPVVNATGIVINTNLGRAPLPEEALELVREISAGYSNLEYDLLTGRRGSRNSHVADYLKDLTGSESAFVVNNNAGAVLLVLHTLAREREVVVSRGELVEIGGSFRIPEIMASSGAILREVGTTNRTRLSDYEDAIGENTAILMKVHRSNFYISGFTEEVSARELADLGRKYGITTYYDIGSGLITDILLPGSGEVSFSRALKDGVDIVSGSGDKLLGGPQAGIILGKEELIEKIRRNPIARALRVDKMTLAGLEAVLRMYLEGRHEEIPVVRMLSEREEVIKSRAKRLIRRLRDIEGLETSLIKDVAKPGGGSMPELELPTWCVACSFRDMPPDELSASLRLSEPPVVGRVHRGRFLLDMRTVSDDELSLIRTAFELLNY